MPETLHSILTGYKAKDLIEKNSELYKSTMYYQKSPASPVVLDANMTVRDGATVLADNHISSAPIVEEGKFIGQLEMRDLVKHVLQVLNDVPISNDSDWALGDLLGQVSQTNRPLKSLEKHHQLVSAKMDTPLIDIVEEFTRANAHRVAVFDKEKFVGVISQSTIANLVVGQFGLRKAKGGAVWETGEKTVADLGIVQTKIVSVLPTDTVMQALFLMDVENVSSCAVIQNKKLHGSISATDIKLILSQRNGWRKVFQTCADFFKAMRNEQVLERNGEATIPNFTIHANTKLVAAMEKMAATRTHRLWVTDENEAIIGLVSLSAIVPLLLK